MNDFDVALNEFLAMHDWSLNTVDRYRRAIVEFRQEFGDDQGKVGVYELRRWLEGGRWNNRTQRLMWTGIRNWLRWRYGKDHPALLLKIKRIEPPPQRSLKLNQVQALLASFDTSKPVGRRDLAMCGLMLDSALRVSEVAALDLKYLDLEGQTLNVIVKGGQWAKGWFSQQSAIWLAAWLADRDTIAVSGETALFVSVVGVAGHTPGRRMTAEGIQCNVRTWGRRAGLVALSPHDLRRTFGNLTARAGANARVAMAAGRWRDEKSYRRYTLDVGPADIEPYSPVTQAMRA